MLFANGAENIVGALLGHVFQLGHITLQWAFAKNPAGTDGHFRVYEVIAGTPCIGLRFTGAQPYFDTLLLVRREYAVTGKVGRKYERAGQSEHQHAGLDTVPSVQIAPPRIAQSPVQFECRLTPRWRSVRTAMWSSARSCTCTAATTS